MGILTGLLSRSLENPEVPLTDVDAETWGITASASGVSVTHDSAMRYPAVWRAVSLISGDVAKLPLVLYRRVGEGKARAIEHPAYRLLKHKANAAQTVVQFRRAMTARAILWGNAYALIERNRRGEPLSLTMLPTSTVPVDMPDGRWYVYEIKGVKYKIRPENAIHIQGLGDGTIGWSLVSYAKNSLGLGMAAEEYGNRFFKNDARPGVVLEHPGVPTAEQVKQIRSQWNEIHQGTGNAHRVAVLTGGMKLAPWSMPLKDAQFLETRQFQVRDVANWFGLPPHKLGDTSRTSYNSLEQENQAYLDECLDHWLVTWESECWDKLLTEEQKATDSHVVEFTRQALLRAQMQQRYQAYAVAITNGFMSRNEVRARENLNPYDGGDEFLTPLNMQKGEELVDEEPDPPPAVDEDADEAARERLLADVLGRMTRRLETHRDKALRNGTISTWNAGGVNKHRQVILDALEPVCGVLGLDAAEVADALIAAHVNGGTLDAAELLQEKCDVD